MPENAPIQFSLGSLPSPYCFTGFQEFANDLVSILTGNVPGTYSTFVIGSNTPDATDRDKIWFKTDAGTDLLISPQYAFRYYSGQWLAEHRCAASGDERRLFVGSAAELDTYDGGSAGAVTDTTGPFWEIDTDFAGRSPIGVGTIPDTSTTLAVEDDHGSGIHTLTKAELPDETLRVRGLYYDDTTGGTQYQTIADTNYDPLARGELSNILTDPMGDGDGHANVHPVRAVYIIKRTARIYYVG